MNERIDAEIAIDSQHGPIVTVIVGGRRVSVYLIHEAGTVIEPNGSHYGIDVKGSWWKFRRLMEAPMIGDSMKNQCRDEAALVAELKAEIERLRKCCTQRSARMQIMKEWMENFEAGSLWTGSVWDALCEIRDSDVWFDADGVPR